MPFFVNIFCKCLWAYRIALKIVNDCGLAIKLKSLPQLNKLIKHFDKINKNVGVNRAPVRTRHSGRAGDSGRDTFEK